jgi:hypothetical protein
MKKNSFTKWTNRSLARIFEGKRVTVNTLRHSYISNLDFNAKTPGDLMRSAKMMGHSVNQQQLYRRLPDPEDSEKREDSVRTDEEPQKIERKVDRGATDAVEAPAVRKNLGETPRIPKRNEKAAQKEARTRGGIVVERASAIPRDRRAAAPAKWGERGSFVVSL